MDWMLIINYLIIFIIIFLVFNYINKIYLIIKRKFLIERYSELLTVLEKASDVAYKKIFRDDVLVHAASGFRINQDEISKLQKRYIALTVSFCGYKIINELEEIHGDLDSLVSILSNDFIAKLENDEAAILAAANQKEFDDKSELLK